MDRFGRKFTIQTGAMICLIGATLQAAAQNLAMILVGRILAGWAVGLLSMSVPVYQAEFAHPQSRGLIVGMAQQMIGVGFIVSTYVENNQAKSGLQGMWETADPLRYIDGLATDPSMRRIQANSSGDSRLLSRWCRHWFWWWG